MSAATPHPFSRPFDVRSLPAAGLDARVEAKENECAALARDFDLPAVAAVEGEYRVRPSSRGQVVVRGRARARLTRLCVVSLEPFEVAVDEPVDVVFAPDAARPARGAVTAGRTADEETDLAALATPDPPDPIVDGRIDLGALTAEFVALGLDPYPRKPGAEFSGGDAEAAGDTAFSALAGVKTRQAPDK